MKFMRVLLIALLLLTVKMPIIANDNDDYYLKAIKKFQISEEDPKEKVPLTNKSILRQLPFFSNDHFIIVAGDLGRYEQFVPQLSFTIYDATTLDMIGQGNCFFEDSRKGQIISFFGVDTNMDYDDYLDSLNKMNEWGDFSFGCSPSDNKNEGHIDLFRGTAYIEYRWNYEGTKSALRGSGEILTALDNFLISVETNKLLQDKMISPEKYQAMRARLDAKLAADAEKREAEAAARRKAEAAELEKRNDEARAQSWEEQKNEPGLPTDFPAAHAGAVQRLKDKFFPGAAEAKGANPRSGRYTPRSLGAALGATFGRGRRNHANCVVLEGVVKGAPVTIGLYHGLSPADAAEGLAYLRLAFCRPGEPDDPQAPERRARTLRECPRKLGDRCFSGSGVLLSDMRPRGQSAEAELYFFVGNTVAMVIGDDPEQSVYPVAQKLEALLKNK